jgi:signal peptidase I
VSGEPESPATNDRSEVPVDAKSPSPRIAGLLAILFGTTGLVYAGRMRRALAWVLLQLLSLILVACLLLYLPYGRAAWAAMALICVACFIGLLVDTVRAARCWTPPRRWYQRWWSCAIYGLLMSLAIDGVVQLSRTFWEEAFYLPTGSMEPTLLAGDRILVDKLHYRLRKIRRGDVVVHWIDNALTDRYRKPPGRQLHVKRVIGIPGDTIEFRDEKLYRNNELVDEPYAIFLSWDAPDSMTAELRNSGPVVVPEREYFLVGDNRRRSLDSRLTGLVAGDDIIGKVAIIYWSREPAPVEEPDFRLARDRPQSREAALPRKIRWSRFGQRVE